MTKFLMLSKPRNEGGAIAVVVALVLFLLLGFAALTIDIGHLCVVRNELSNAADAGALAGARFLYNDDGTIVNEGANQIAYDTATENKSENADVEVNDGDVQRGHWSFGVGDLECGFYPNPSTDPVDLWNVSTEELDANPNFINAVRVATRRQSIPVLSFFARIFGYENFQSSAEAVAYIGFAGTLRPEDVDQPIAICKQSLLIEDKYSCSIGRMINSGQNVESHETGGWTSFSQDDACTGGTNAEEVKGLVCSTGNSEMITLGDPIATNGGDIQSAFNQLIQCWAAATGKIQPWNLTLPVIDCPSNNVGTCEVVRGAVNLNIVWITDAGEDPQFNNAPTQMGCIEGSGGDWLYEPWDDMSYEPDGQTRWNDFVQHFNLQNVDGEPAPYVKKSIYFLPDCTPHVPAGVSGGENYGILAKIPVLVQ
jgi:hypothetical protein